MTDAILKNLTTDQLIPHLAGAGFDARIARQLQGLAMRRRLLDLPIDPPFEIKRHKWERIRTLVSLPRLDLVETKVSPVDGFAKFLFRGAGPQLFEAVRIPLLHRPGHEKFIICVSSQVGCSAGCAFCATGKMGFKRNLEPWEIVDQVVQIQNQSEHRIGGVVFMGMGEPLLNFERVMRAAKIMTDPSGLAIDGKAITISTVGIVPGIRRFAELNPQYRFILSLHSAIPEKRRHLVPVAETYSLEKIFNELRSYYGRRKRRITLAWTMLKGINTGEDEALALKKLIKDLPVIIDLIPVNDDSGRFDRPTDEEFQDFLNYLRQHVQQPIVCRYSGGKDIAGACGMLAAQQYS